MQKILGFFRINIVLNRHIYWHVLFLFLFICNCSPKSSDKPITEQVTIRRDIYGVPHILAETEEAASFGAGYVQAEDNLELIAKLYLIGKGEASVYFGDEYIESDFNIIRFKIKTIAEERFDELSSKMRNLITCYADGVNHFINKNRDKIPDWIKQIKPQDVLTYGRYVILNNFIYSSSRYKNDRRRIMQMGSNMWAISPKRSESGKAMLLANPHLPWTGTFTWYEMHITVPKKLNIAGATSIGFPIIVVGHNEHLTWTQTNNSPDLVDIYELELVEKNHYKYDDKIKKFEIIDDSIKVKINGGYRWEKKDIYYSVHGPVIGFKGSKAYAVKYAGFNDIGFSEEWYDMGKAVNFDQFVNAVKKMEIPMFNICYADDKGNIFYIYNGQIPKRAKGYNWKDIVPGSTSKTEWMGYHKFEELPYLINPKSGYLQNCNDPPWYTSLQDLIPKENYPDYFEGDHLGLRTQRSLLMLEGDKKISFDEMVRYKFDSQLVLADRLKPELINICEKKIKENVKSKKLLTEIVNILKDWDNTAKAESRGANLFILWWNEYIKKANPIYKENWNSNKPIETPSGIGDPETALNSLIYSARELERIYGRIDIKWGENHRIKRGNIDLPIGGGDGNLGIFRVIRYNQFDNIFYADGGDSFVMAVEFSVPLKVFSILPYGISGNPNSKHYNDQMYLFASERLKPAFFTEEEIMKNLEKAYNP